MVEVTLDLLVSALGLGVVGCYSWSLRGHFSSPRMPDGAKVISLFVLATAVFFFYLVWAYDQPAWAQIVGLVLQAASAGLFWWAIAASRKARLRYAFDPEEPRGLVTTGPYSYLRHPFYTSYLIFWSGWAIATASPWSTVSVAVFVVIYVLAARREEKLFSESPMAGEYRAYRAKTGYLLPRINRT